jgi:F0F1-type ATP synthase assembly protein I
VSIAVERVVPLTLLAQAGVSMLLAGVLWLRFGDTVAVSTLLGGAAAVVPNGFLAARVLTPNRPVDALLRGAWIGEMGKILLTALAFGVIFGFVRPIAPPAVFAGFIAAQLVVFGALLVGDGGRSGSVAKSTDKKELETKS